MNPLKHSEEDLPTLLTSLKREKIRCRRLKSRYLELKKSNFELRIDFFEDNGSSPSLEVSPDLTVPDEQVLGDLLENLTRILADLFRFMKRYDTVRKERPDRQIPFVESIKNQHIPMNSN